MTLVTLLLAVIVLLLLVIIAMLLTGWPGRQREELERVGNSLRREMAEHRAESIRMMNAIRITVEDSIQESVEREMAAARPRSRSRRAPAKAVPTVVPGSVDAAQDNDVAVEESVQSVLEARQISIFDQMAAEMQASSESMPADMAVVPATSAASSAPVIGDDDLPDVD